MTIEKVIFDQSSMVGIPKFESEKGTGNSGCLQADFENLNTDMIFVGA